MTSILGISAFYHDSAAALIVDGDIVAAAQEERFSRKKHDLNFDRTLDNLKNTHFDKVVIIQHFLESYTYSLEKVKEKLSIYQIMLVQ